MARFGQRFNVPKAAPNKAEAGPAKSAVKQVNKSAKPTTPQKVVEKKVQEKNIQEEVFVRQSDAKQIQENVKQERSVKADVFTTKQDLAAERDVSVSQFASDVADRKKQAEKRQDFAQNLNQSNLGSALAKPKTAKADAPVDQSVSSTVSQSSTESLDPDAKAKRKAEKMLNRIAKEGGDKGKAFVDFAKREIAKGRQAEIDDLIEGFHDNLKGDSLTAAELVESGEEPVSILRHMVSVENTDDLNDLNNQIAVRPDTEVGFKKDQLMLRNKALAKKQLPPSFKKAIKPKKIEAAIAFISSFGNATNAPAPWDAVAA